MFAKIRGTRRRYLIGILAVLVLVPTIYVSAQGLMFLVGTSHVTQTVTPALQINQMQIDTGQSLNGGTASSSEVCSQSSNATVWTCGSVAAYVGVNETIGIQFEANQQAALTPQVSISGLNALDSILFERSCSSSLLSSCSGAWTNETTTGYLAMSSTTNPNEYATYTFYPDVAGSFTLTVLVQES